MAKDWKQITDDEVLNYDEAHTGNMARYERIMQMRSIEATRGLRDKITGLMETIYRASQGVQQNIGQLVEGLDKATTAANAAAAASARHARNLAWATWALVVVTVVLAIITAWPR